VAKGALSAHLFIIAKIYCTDFSSDSALSRASEISLASPELGLELSSFDRKEAHCLPALLSMLLADT